MANEEDQAQGNTDTQQTPEVLVKVSQDSQAYHFSVAKAIVDLFRPTKKAE